MKNLTNKILYTVALLFLIFPLASHAEIGSSVWNIKLGTYLQPASSSGLGVLLYGTSKYLNFGTTYGSSGYGVRDNSGTIEVKDSGGSWATIQTGASSGTVTSVGLSVPTGLSVSGSPVTTTGTLAVTLGAGYVIPLQSTLNGYLLASEYFATTTHPNISSLPALSITKSQVSDFGSYENPLTFNYPLSRSTNTISTVATSSLNLGVNGGGTGQTTFTASQLLYGNGTNALSSTATTTLTGTAPIVFSNPISVIGGSASAISIPVATASANGYLSSVDWSIFNNKWDLASSTIGAIYGGTSQSTYTAGDMLYASATNILSKLTAGASSTVMTINVSGVPVWTNAPVFSSLTVSNAAVFSSTLNVVGLTTLGFASSTDFSVSNSFKVPQNKTLSANGELTTDDTSGQFRTYAGGSQRVFSPFFTMVGAYATSTWNGTTTLFMAPAMMALTVQDAYCETNVGTVNVSLYDGSNRSNLINASTTKGLFTFDTNNTFTAGESIRVDMGTPATAPTNASCRFRATYDAN